MRQLTAFHRVVLTAVCAALVGFMLPAIARADETVSACAGGGPNLVWAASGNDDASCINGGLTMNGSANSTGTAGSLTATAPSGLEVVSTPMSFLQPSEFNAQGQQVFDDEWETEYDWSGGYLDAAYPLGDCPGAAIPGDPSFPCGWSGAYPTSFASSSFSIALACDQASCADRATLAEPSPALVIAETKQPTLSAASGTVGSTTEWLRGTWPLSLSGSAPSGLCSISAQINNLGLGSTSSPQNTAAWQQCSSTSLTGTVDTTKFPNGTDTFTATGSSAAGNAASINSQVKIDNTTPSITLSGPSDVAVGSGPAQITATATGGPSGIATIDCNVDGVSQTFPETGQTTAAATIPLSGVGQHSVSCFAQGGALDTSGDHASSPVATSAMTIRTPTAALASFDKVVDKRVCHAVKKKITVPAGWHEITWHGHKVRAKLPAHRVTRKVQVCRERLARRRITVYKTVRRHGHKTRVKKHKTVKVPLAPHEITKGIRTVAFGHTTKLGGTLDTSTGTALSGQVVSIMGAPRTGRGDFKQIATATTNADGNWTATVPKGPGRVLEAVFGGNSTTEPATSDQVRTIVHAKVRLGHITPARVPWTGKIKLRGKLPGGHVPHKGINVRLVYGIGHHSITYAVRQHVGARRHNRFVAHFIFGPGPARTHERFFFEVCTLPSADYPYAVGCSKKHTVAVGGHPKR